MLRARLAAFSNWPLSSFPPASSPPCAASRTTTNLPAGAGGACCAGTAMDITAKRTAGVDLLQCIDGQAAQKLGEEVSGLLGHYRAGKGNLAQLLHRNRVREESNIGFTAPDLVYCLRRITKVADVGLFTNLFGVQAKQAVEDDGVQVAQVQLTLIFRQGGKSFGSRLRLGTKQVSALPGYCYEGRPGLLAE